MVEVDHMMSANQSPSSPTPPMILAKGDFSEGRPGGAKCSRSLQCFHQETDLGLINQGSWEVEPVSHMHERPRFRLPHSKGGRASWRKFELLSGHLGAGCGEVYIFSTLLDKNWAISDVFTGVPIPRFRSCCLVDLNSKSKIFLFILSYEEQLVQV